jgi:GNAT superfamily N-acetyltransferase
MSNYVIRKAKVEDGEFISIAAREAERCNVGVGIFDLLAYRTRDSIVAEPELRTQPDITSKYLLHTVLNSPASHIYWDKYLMVEDTVTGRPVACACYFPYPEFSLSSTIPGLCDALQNELGYTKAQTDSALQQWDFLGTSFPDVEFDNSWMVESVYVDPIVRGKGLGNMVVKACMDAQNDYNYSNGDKTSPAKENRLRRNLITCAVGNDAAKRTYEKLGFHLLGSADTEECRKVLFCPGFHVLSTEKDYVKV